MTSRAHRVRGPGLRLSGIAAAALAATACGPSGGGGTAGGGGEAGGGELPPGNVTIIVPSAPGGGFDASARQLQPYLEEALGRTVVVENQEGGAFAIGAQGLLNHEDDCSSMMIHGRPLLQFSYLAQEVDYTYDDFYPVGGYTIEPAVIRVADDSGYETLVDLVEDAKANPGQVRVSISGVTDNNHIGILQIQEATGAVFNIVPYDGGGPARTAVASGEVTWTHAGMFNSLSIADSSRVVAVHQDENEWPEATDDAPTVNEALGIDVPPNDTTYGLYVTSACHDQHPEQHETLVEAFQAATSDEEFQQSLEDLGELDKLRVVEADAYDQENREAEDDLRDIVQELSGGPS